jgi:UMF1 family MFS transporter
MEDDRDDDRPRAGPRNLRLLSLGILQVSLGLQSAILLCSLFFLVALVLTLFVREQRARAAAAAFETR